jgi:hypothetical protein
MPLKRLIRVFVTLILLGVFAASCMALFPTKRSSLVVAGTLDVEATLLCISDHGWKNSRFRNAEFLPEVGLPVEAKSNFDRDVQSCAREHTIGPTHDPNLPEPTVSEEELVREGALRFQEDSEMKWSFTRVSGIRKLHVNGISDYQTEQIQGEVSVDSFRRGGKKCAAVSAGAWKQIVECGWGDKVARSKIVKGGVLVVNEQSRTKAIVMLTMKRKYASDQIVGEGLDPSSYLIATAKDWWPDTDQVLGVVVVVDQTTPFTLVLKDSNGNEYDRHKIDPRCQTADKGTQCLQSHRS